jgi:hypothetical protein
LPELAATALRVMELPHTCISFPANAGFGAFITSILTSSKVLPQLAVEIVHLNIFIPAEILETLVELLETLEKVPFPEITLQLPTPIVGMFEFNWVKFEQICWSVPAFDALGSSNTCTNSVSDVFGQILPDDMVYTNILLPTCKLLALQVAEFILSKLEPPAITCQEPEPTVGILPFREIVFAHCVALLPASAIVGNEKDSMVMSENPVEQTPSVIVHLNTLEPMFKLLTFVVGLELSEKFAFPETIDH